MTIFILNVKSAIFVKLTLRMVKMRNRQKTHNKQVAKESFGGISKSFTDR